MSIKTFVEKEMMGWSKEEIVFFPTILFGILIVSVLAKDSPIATLSAIFGLTYTIIAGKGKISCYFIGMIGTFCYSFIAFKNGFYGNLVLYMLYYLPMEIIGILKWRKHLKKEVREIIKTRLSNKDRLIYTAIVVVLSVCLSFILKLFNGSTPFLDGTVTVLSIVGQLLTVKRCVEQWYVWFVVNLLSLVMWIFAYINGSNCFATIIMWAVYLVLSVYFLQVWKREVK